jgi:large subunit ribosomal protein L18
MRSIAAERRVGRARRHQRIRQAVRGTADRPRMSVYRSLKNLYVQIIDDNLAKTIASVSTLEKDIRSKLTAEKSGLKRSRMVGKLIAERAKEHGIAQVAFDRGGYLYHGHVKEVAEGAREGGLKF